QSHIKRKPLHKLASNQTQTRTEHSLALAIKAQIKVNETIIHNPSLKKDHFQNLMNERQILKNSNKQNHFIAQQKEEYFKEKLYKEAFFLKNLQEQYLLEKAQHTKSKTMFIDHFS